MNAPRLVLGVLLMVLAASVHAAGSGPVGGGWSSGGANGATRNPEQLANSAYKKGQKYKKRALGYEEDARETEDAVKREKYLAKARKAFEKSADEYLEAYRYKQDFPEALNELGFAYRKLDKFDDAIRAYNTALKVRPDYAEAIEYRGEAYLALGMLDRTKEAYMTLFRSNPEQAALLMEAMGAWVGEREGERNPEAEEFARWVEARRALAEGTQTLSLNNARDW